MKFLLQNTRYIVICIVSGIILYTREVEALWCSGGGIVCGLIAKFLKHWIKEPRPHQPIVETKSLFEIFHSSNDYGMPSSHTATMVYFATYATWYSNRWWVLILIWAIVLFTSWSRVHYRYHTRNQVVAGALLGMVVAFLFFHFFRMGIHRQV
jgi:membrane-associated phospholipid phosphatase